MSIPSTLASGAWLAASLPSWLRFRRGLHDPRSAQEHILRSLLTRNADCEYGREYEFGGIRNYAAFREKVPLVNHDDLAPMMDRIAHGEVNVLTAEPVTNLIPTSGSSGGRKLIPFTAGLQREFNAAIGPWMVDMFGQQPAMAMGSAYWSISPALPHRDDEDCAIPVGFEDDSSYLGGMRRRLVEATFAAPSLLRQAPDIETSRYLTLLCLLRRRDLALISVWHPSFLSLLLDALPMWWGELLEDVKTGGCRRTDGLKGELARAMTTRAQPNRANDLARLAPNQAEKIWPRLKMISCWGDGQASLALSDLQRRFPETQIQPKGLLATEAFISIPFGGFHPVAVRSHFYEFRDSDGSIHPVHELTTGKIYSVVATTGGGLWRYALGDLVEVDGFVDRTPSLRFLGREGKVSDLGGEKLSETFVTKSISRAFVATGHSPGFAMLAAEREEQGPWRYVLFVEGEVSVQVAEILDRELRENPHYAICRNLGQLGPARCFKVSTGAYELYVKTRMERGQLLGEIKPQALSLEPGWAGIFPGHYVTNPDG